MSGVDLDVSHSWVSRFVPSEEPEQISRPREYDGARDLPPDGTQTPGSVFSTLMLAHNVVIRNIPLLLGLDDLSDHAPLYRPLLRDFAHGITIVRHSSDGALCSPKVSYVLGVDRHLFLHQMQRRAYIAQVAALL